MPAIERPENAKPYTAATPRITNAVKITNQTDVAVEIWLNGEVGWDIVASELLPLLKANDGEGKTIILWTNSGGGDVFEGYMIGNYLPSLKATVVVRPLAMIGSIATYMAVKADRIEMPENSMFVIHEASAIVSGRSSDLRNHAEVMDKLNDQIASAYTAKRVSLLGSADGEDFRALMATGDVWLTAREASALGLIDLITDAVALTGSVRPELLDALNAPAEIRAALAATAEEANADALAVEEEAPPAPTEEELAAQAAAEEKAKAQADAEAAAAAQAEADAAAAQAALEAEAAAAAEAAQTAESEAAITAVCRAFEAADRAPEFIAAKASLVDVRKALWKAAAARDAQITTDPTPPAAQIPEGDAYAKRADKARNDYASALTR